MVFCFKMSRYDAKTFLLYSLALVLCMVINIFISVYYNKFEDLRFCIIYFMFFNLAVLATTHLLGVLLGMVITRLSDDEKNGFEPV